MLKIKFISVLLPLLVLNTSVFSMNLSAFSSSDALSALQITLDKGADLAVSSLGTKDGFLNNEAVRIKLPEFLEKNRGLMKMLGMSSQLDNLEVSMNRAAEAAVPQSKVLLKKAIKSMSVTDAKQLVNGGETSVTDFFKSKTESDLYKQLLPIVKEKTSQAGIAQQYNNLAKKGSRFGLVDEDQANLEGYVTHKALDALFLMIAQEEKSIRADPVSAGSAVLKKVFGAK